MKNVLKSLELQCSVSASEMCLWLVFFELFQETWFRLMKRMILGGYAKTGIAGFF